MSKSRSGGEYTVSWPLSVQASADPPFSRVRGSRGRDSMFTNTMNPEPKIHEPVLS